LTGLNTLGTIKYKSKYTTCTFCYIGSACSTGRCTSYTATIN